MKRNLLCLALILPLLALVNHSFGASDKTGPPTEAEVKAVFEKHHKNRDADETVITFDSPVRVAPATTGQQAPLLGKTLYPVKFDYTVADIYKGKVWPRTMITHYSGGVYEFYREAFGDWNFNITTQPQMKQETKEIKK